MMSDTSRPKRMQLKSGRPASAERAQPTTPPPEPDVVDGEATYPRRPISPEGRSRRSVPRQKVDAMPARIATLEAELARINEARGADADELAHMLVRMAEAERARATHEERATAFEEKVRELKVAVGRLGELEEACEAMRKDLETAHGRAQRDAEALEVMRERARQDGEALHAAEERLRHDADIRRTTEDRMRRDAEAVQRWQESARREAEAAELSSHRAELAEHAAAEGARALHAAHEERDADRERVTDLEAKLARTRREHAEEATSLRRAHSEAEHEGARALEEERAATALAREKAASAEAEIASMRSRVERATELLEAMERREEMAAAIRARAVDQVRQALFDGDAAPARTVSQEPRERCGDEPSVEVMSLEDLEIDLPD
jgi:chromosome segregation ATPase